MRICITAANCFVGLPLVKKASTLGWEVIAVLREENKQRNLLQNIPNVKVKELNLEDYDKLGQVIGSVDCLVMLTWNGTRGANRDNHLLQESNYLNCLAGIKSAVEAGCKRIITAGSQAEYGPIHGKITEKSVCNPVTAYGKAKLKLFREAQRFCGQKNVIYIDARIFSLYGPGDYANSLILSTMKKMEQNDVCDLTKGIQLWDYLYIDDAVSALVALSTEGKSGIYNLASGDCRPLKDFVLEMKLIMKSKSKIRFGVVPYGSGGPVNINPSIERIKELGWEPKISFAEGIQKLAHYLQEIESLKTEESQLGD